MQQHRRASADAVFAVAGIGASAGGLTAFRKLLDALPPDSGMAFILIQHLDPTHESLMVELLTGHTPMTVQHAADGMLLEPDGVYIIPPGVYLSVRDGALRLSKPVERHGARLPFDFLLHSLAAEFGDRAICVVLSGTGTDGSLGLKAIKEKGGLVIAQEPEEAGYDGMPRSAIRTGLVDLVLPLDKIPEALVAYHRRMALVRTDRRSEPEDAESQGWLAEIIDILRAETPRDFTSYKPGTLHRQIERRMAMAAIESDDMNRYLDVLRSDPDERELLVKDLLINVTGFFRDPKAFEFLAEKIAPDLLGDLRTGKALRIWVVGCSSGEEAYSLAMLFDEQISESKRNVGLQVFASDVDPDAIASAREGLYPETIEADMSPERLARFFIKEDLGYRVSSKIRAAVVFTVQDVLADPPFSRVDMISCRNLLIYLKPEAQAKVVSLFHFALREDGILLLGNAEAIGDTDPRFKVISKPDRLYRHIGRSRPGELAVALRGADVIRPARRPDQEQSEAPSRNRKLAELCQRLVIATHAPAAILVNRKNECLYFLGPTERYLRAPAGQPTHDVLVMARDGVRTKLRAAIQRASHENARVVIGGGRTGRDEDAIAFRIDVQPVEFESETGGESDGLLLICFVEEAKPAPRQGRADTPQDAVRVGELERELEATRTELESAIRNLEKSTAEQMEIAEETLSVNEEFQATNEELLTSKEELQSVNEELTALNSQIQETLERERTTSNDLQNILNSTDIATLFLDTDLNIRFFTPGIKSFFHIIPGDIGRPLADLSAMAVDRTLPTDARAVVAMNYRTGPDSGLPIEREVEGEDGACFVRRTLPYRTRDGKVEGVVITYTDITERKRTADALEAAKREAERANAAKSRFLAAASHDLRQPLQTLVLLQGLLANTVEDSKAQQLTARLGGTLSAMSGMLNALLDINQIEAGIVDADAVDFPIDEMFAQLRDESVYFAEAKGLGLRVVPCSLSVRSDPKLLAQIMRNLLSNAIKYTKSGRILIGCRRRRQTLRIEVWDTGIGIADEDLQRVFEEYYQADNPARDHSRGLGLGLSIVQRLANLLGHSMHVRSDPGKGSVFGIEVMLAEGERAPQKESDRTGAHDEPHPATGRSGAILVVEDDPEVRELLEAAFEAEGHSVNSAADGSAALELLADGTAPPDLIVSDYNLPNDMNGLQVVAEVRQRLDRELPAIVLTGDISPDSVRDIARANCTHLTKPVNATDLAQIVQSLLPSTQSAARSPETRPAEGAPPVVYVIDDDSHVLEELCSTIGGCGFAVEGYPSAEAFLQAYRPNREACLIVDAYLPGISGLELLDRLENLDHRLTTIVITGRGDVAMAVRAMKAGASDFLEKPVGEGDLMASIRTALERSVDAAERLARKEDAAKRLAELTPRQRQVMALTLDGLTNKTIAWELGISQRTVENHRAAIMKRTGSKSLAALARLALAAPDEDADDPGSADGQGTNVP